jgi:hypothetical protein
MYFKVPSDFVYADTYKFEKEQNGEKVNRVPGVCWFTNIDHGRRHQPLPLMTMSDNLKFSKHKELKGKTSYDKYENYDALMFHLQMLFQAIMRRYGSSYYFS